MEIRLSYSGRNYDQAAELPQRFSVPNGATVGEALDAARAALPAARSWPETCLVAVSGVHLGTLRHHQRQVLHEGDELLIVAPVSGG